MLRAGPPLLGSLRSLLGRRERTGKRRRQKKKKKKKRDVSLLPQPAYRKANCPQSADTMNKSETERKRERERERIGEERSENRLPVISGREGGEEEVSHQYGTVYQGGSGVTAAGRSGTIAVIP